jgi:hypothetical protein
MLFSPPSQQNHRRNNEAWRQEAIEELWQVIESSPEAPKNRLKGSERGSESVRHADGRLCRQERSLQLPLRSGSYRAPQEDDLTLSCVNAVCANHCVYQHGPHEPFAGRLTTYSKPGSPIRLPSGCRLAWEFTPLEDATRMQLAHHMMAYRLAQSLGNDSLIRGACLNSPLCNGRLGRWSSLLEWAEKGVPSCLSIVFAGNKSSATVLEGIWVISTGQSNAAAEADPILPDARLQRPALVSHNGPCGNS